AGCGATATGCGAGAIGCGVGRAGAGVAAGVCVARCCCSSFARSASRRFFTSSSTFAVSIAGCVAVALVVVGNDVVVADVVAIGVGAIGGRTADDAVCTGVAGAELFDFIKKRPTAIAITATTPMMIGTIGAFFCAGAAAITLGAAANDAGITGAAMGAGGGVTAAGFDSRNGSGSDI